MPPYGVDRLPELVSQLERQGFGPLGPVTGGERDAVGLERRAGEDRPEAVVQLAPQSCPLLLGGVDQPLPRRLSGRR